MTAKESRIHAAQYSIEKRLRSSVITNIAAKDAPTNDAIDDRKIMAINRVREYLEAHFKETVTLEFLARFSSLSKSQLVRLFHRATGLPPHAYLNRVRIERAKELLHEGETAARVALKTGFFDQSHLTRHFKKIAGMTPSQYRAKSKNIQDAPAEAE
jgi:AraC-like DNA-binding protein